MSFCRFLMFTLLTGCFMMCTMGEDTVTPSGFLRAKFHENKDCWELLPQQRSVLKGILTDVDADRNKGVRLEISSRDAYVGQMEFINQAGVSHRESFLIRNRDGYQTYVLDMSGNSLWTGRLKEINLHFISRDNHTRDPREIVYLRSPKVMARANFLPSKLSGRVELDTLLPGNTYCLAGAELLRLAYCDIDGNEKELKFSENQEFILPVDAMIIILVLQPAAAAELFLTRHRELRPPSASKMDWKASWIWYPEKKVIDNSRRYFKKEFILPENVKSAWACVTADDKFQMSVNGVPVGKGDNWGIPQIIDMKMALRSGQQNTIVIDVFNFLGGAGVRAEFAFKTEDGETISLLTGTGWESSRDCRKWKSAAVVPGPMTPYVDVALATNLKAGGLTAAPAKISLRPGFPSTGLRWKGKQPEILVDGETFLPYAYHFSGGFFHSPLPELPIVDECVKSGVHLYTITDEYYLNKVWPEEKRFNFVPFDHCIRNLLARDPKAKIILEPSLNMPKWWQMKYPGEIIRTFDPSRGWKTQLPSPASMQWRKDGARYLEALMKHMEKSDYARSIIAVLPSALQTIEWIYWPLQVRSSADMSDYSEASVREFRHFVKQKYGKVEKLRHVYHDPDVEFESLALPLPEQLSGSEIGVFRNPEQSQYAIDYWEFRNRICADTVLFFCRLVKEVSGGRLLSGSYFGYFLEHIPHENLVRSGHIMLDRIVKDPSVDILCAPADYLFRMPDLPAGAMAPADTLRLHNKLWIQEDDIRGYLSKKSYMGRDNQYSHGKTDTPIDNVELLRKQYAFNRAQGYGFWWYDLNGGWFNNAHIFQALLGRWVLREKESRYDKHQFDFPVEVAWVIDGYHSLYTRMTGVVPLASRSQFKTFNRMPAPRDVIQLTDFRDCKLPEYKIYIFLNCFVVSPELRERIHRQLSRNNAVAVWIGTAGFFNGVTGQAPDCANVEKLTGFRTELVKSSKSVTTVLKDLGKTITWRYPGTADPLFVIRDPSAKCLSRDGKLTVVAEKKMQGWRSIFFTGHYLPPEALEILFRCAGVHLYSNVFQDYFYMGYGFAGMNIVKSGKKQLSFPMSADIMDYETGEILQRNVKTFYFDAKAGTTRLFSVRYSGKQ